MYVNKECILIRYVAKNEMFCEWNVNCLILLYLVTWNELIPEHWFIGFILWFLFETGIASILDIALSNWSFEFITVSL